MNYQIPLLLTILLCTSPRFTQAAEDETLLTDRNTTIWLSYNQYQLDYFGDGRSPLTPAGDGVGISHQIDDHWAVAVSYARSDAIDNWPLRDVAIENPRNFAETESTASSVSTAWQAEDYDLIFTYGELDNNERALTRQPNILETVDSKDRVLSISYNRAFNSDNWAVGLGAGSQYVESNNSTVQALISDTAPSIESEFDSTNWSLFLDLDISYWFEANSFSWAPQLSIGWDTEISSSGEPLVIITRAGESRVVSQFDDRVTEAFRTPDAGFWEVSLALDWDSGWGTSVGYGETIAAESDIESLSFDISFSF